MTVAAENLGGNISYLGWYTPSAMVAKIVGKLTTRSNLSREFVSSLKILNIVAIPNQKLTGNLF